jgi:uncharacterized protein YjaZ
MRSYVGGGWYIWHKTERNIQLRKSDAVYRQMTGLDGFVNYMVEPGYPQDKMVDEAIQKAREQDEKLCFLVAKQIIPKGSAVQNYQMKAHRLNRGFRTPEDASVIGRKQI